MTSKPSYENGRSLSRGEFIVHMERLDQTLQSIAGRLDSIEARLNRSRLALSGLFSSALSRYGMAALLAIGGLAATYFGMRWPF